MMLACLVIFCPLTWVYYFRYFLCHDVCMPPGMIFSFITSQDMGETYHPDELDYISSVIDKDGIGIIELSPFVQWWCSEQ